MPKPSPQTPFTLLLERAGLSEERTTEITGLSLSSIKKARGEKEPKGWKALVVEVDRLHRIGREVDRSYIALLEARIAELEEKFSRG